MTKRALVLLPVLSIFLILGQSPASQRSPSPTLKQDGEKLSTLVLGNSFREANGLASRLLADSGIDPATMALCGLATLKAGRIGEAEALFKKVISLSPDNPEAHLGLGRIGRIRNDLDAALVHLRRAVPSASFYGEALRQLWRAAWDRGPVSDLIEISKMAEERFGHESKPVPSWIANNMKQIQGLSGKRLYHLEGRFERLRVPLITNTNVLNRKLAFRLNGNKEYLFDIDSAAADFMTVSPLLAEELGLSMTGSSTAAGVGTGTPTVRFSVLDRVELGSLTFRNVPVMVSDLHTFRGLKKGLIGTGFLKRFNFTIDIKAGVMDLYPLDRPDLLVGHIDPAAVAADVPLYVFDGTTVESTMSGAPPALYILDTAAAANLVDASFFAEHIKGKIDPAAIAPDGIQGAAGAQSANRITGVSIALGPLIFRDQTVHEFSMEILNDITGRYAAGLLGNPLLWPYRVHMNFRAGRLILERYAKTRGTAQHK